MGRGSSPSSTGSSAGGGGRPHSAAFSSPEPPHRHPTRVVPRHLRPRKLVSRTDGPTGRPFGKRSAKMVADCPSTIRRRAWAAARCRLHIAPPILKRILRACQRTSRNQPKSLAFALRKREVVGPTVPSAPRRPRPGPAVPHLPLRLRPRRRRRPHVAGHRVRYSLRPFAMGRTRRPRAAPAVHRQAVGHHPGEADSLRDWGAGDGLRAAAMEAGGAAGP